MKKKYLFLGIVVLIIGIFTYFNLSSAKADEPIDFTYNTDCDLSYKDNGPHDNKREIALDVNNITPGKRITDFVYCLKSDNCTLDSNWHSVTADGNRKVTAFENGVANNDMTFWLNVPDNDIYLKATFEDYEPMDIEYALYKDHNDYVGRARDLAYYDNTFNPLITGYMGGDIILPADCLENGCALKFTLTKENYLKYKQRVDEYNNDLNQDIDSVRFLSLNEMFNHIQTEGVGTDTLLPLYESYDFLEQDEVDNNAGVLLLEEDTENNTVSFYLFVNKYFSENNRADFAVGDNLNRILAEDYIGLNYKVGSKYFDEGHHYGFTSFTEYNNYERDAVLFYGVPKINFSVDAQKPLTLANGGESHMGTLKHPYDTIVSGDQDNYPIVNNVLTITSFYNPDYVVPITLKNGSTKVKDVTLTLNRFAFGEIIVVDNDGNNCRDPRSNPHCSNEEANISVEYRGLYDTFYSNGTPFNATNIIEVSEQQSGLEVWTNDSRMVIERNQDFNPWAVAIYYSYDKVVATRSFDLGSLMKIEGYSDTLIENQCTNTDAYQNTLNNGTYNTYNYGLGCEIPIKDVKYFSESSYKDGNLNYTLIIASKQEIEDNNITKIALFLTNGELKDDHANYPELKYGVGEGKIYEVDHRTFDAHALGGNH